MAARKDSAVEISDDEFEDRVKNGHKLVVVDFFAEWCMPCLMLSPIIDEVADKMKEIKFVKINVDDNQELARSLGVSGIPCLIIFKDGKEVSRIIGSRTSEEIEGKLRKLI